MSVRGRQLPDNPAGTRTDALRLLRQPLRFVADVARGTVQLAIARKDLTTLRMEDIAARNERAVALGAAQTGARQADAGKVRRIAILVPRLARRLPFRADCLVQAMAAQSWLARYGIATRVVIGVDSDNESGFSSHAWLLWGDDVVTGGDIARYQPIFEQGARAMAGARINFDDDL